MMDNGDILIVKNSKGIDLYLINEYGELALSDIRDIVTCYHLQPTRAAQNSEASDALCINSLAPYTKAAMCTV